MIGYVQDEIAEFPDKIKESVKTPAGNNLFLVRENCVRLEEKRATVFHRIVAMLLFVSETSRPDIQIAVAFLSTRTRLS